MTTAESASHAPFAPSRQRLIATLAAGRHRQLSGLGVLVLAGAVLPLAGPQLIRLFIDSVVLDHPFSLLVLISGGFLAVSLVHQALTVAVAYVSTHFAWVATNELREQVARHVLELDLSFHDGHSPGVTLRGVVDAIHTDPGARYGIADLATLAGLSPRHLQRRFTQEIGLPPAAYVERVRIEAAQRALAERDDPLDTIARRYGFGTAETLRRTFHRLVGIAPSDYRTRFRTANA